jgi:hypothetical protein
MASASDMTAAAALAPCPACQGLQVSAQVCSDLFLLPDQPALFHAVADSPRLHALVCLSCGHVALYTKPPGLDRRTAPPPA